MNARQAEGLAICAYEAQLLNLYAYDLSLSSEKKVCIIDTEPMKRGYYKGVWLVYKIVFDPSIIRLKESARACARLRARLTDLDAVKAVNKVEDGYLQISAIRSVAQYAMVAIAWYYLRNMESSVAVEVIEILVMMKGLALTVQNIGLAMTVFQARNLTRKRMWRLEGMPHA